MGHAKNQFSQSLVRSAQKSRKDHLLDGFTFINLPYKYHNWVCTKILSPSNGNRISNTKEIDGNIQGQGAAVNGVFRQLYDIPSKAVKKH